MGHQLFFELMVVFLKRPLWSQVSSHARLISSVIVTLITTTGVPLLLLFMHV